ncbi:MAG: hypothetical protein ABIO82_04355 [Ginsengibacter sp.]
MLQLGKYPSGEVHGEWADKIKDEFRTWFGKYPKKTAITLKQINEYLEKEHE